MVGAFLKLQARRLRASIETTVTGINHKAVIKDLTGRAELSDGYLLMIVFSCLVALLGLLTNSMAVVIGAMLISPLMGPIFTAALAFSLGDLRLAKQALKIIATSILVTVLVAAFFTLLSPLKAPTQEILSRTRPNIYDLLIAAIAGTAGAFALCTRANYLFVTTGVAVATAVIPPLSVVGFGIGTAHVGIALGGFLLFFTNLVAILISSDVVFHIFRFRPSMVEETRYPVRRRVQILGVVLALISVPLVYTLVADIKKAKLTSQIERVMKRHLDSKHASRMTDCSFQQAKDGLTVAASVNTVSYFDVSKEKGIENELTATLDRPVRLELEQVIVKPGHVELKVPSLLTPLVVPPPPQPQTLATLRQKALERLQEGSEALGPFLNPYPITQSDIRFSGQRTPPIVMITIARDYAFSEDEQRWLKTALEKEFGEPLVLELETVPFLPPLSIGDDGKPDEASRKALAALKLVAGNIREAHFVITAPRTNQKNYAQKKQDIAAFKDYLINGLSLPPTAISRGPDHGTDYRVRIEPSTRTFKRVSNSHPSTPLPGVWP